MLRVLFPMLVSFATLSLLAAGSALAQQGEPSAREKELEELVRRLNERVTRLEQRLGSLEFTGEDSAANAPDPAIEARIDDLEATVTEIKQSAPPPGDSQEWKRMREWISNGHTMRPFWKDGLRFESMDKSFQLRVGGRIQHDWTYIVEDDDIERTLGADIDDGTEFRRARMYISGNIYDNIEFKVQYDFADGDADFKDVYMGFTDVPVVGSVRVGQFKEPFGLGQLISSNYTTFLERSLVDTFAPGRNTGVMVRDQALDKRLTWAVGVFRQTDDFGDGVGGRDYNATARITGLPWYEDHGKRLLHVGVAYTHQNYENDFLRFRARPESHLAPRFLDTGAFSAEYGDIVDAELALVHGPFSLQGEYAQAFIESRTMSDPSFWSASIQASYFLTGEHRPYSKSNGVFKRVRPIHPVGSNGGSGAWELAARYSYIDLNDARVRGGKMWDFTLGVNWYLNPSLRIMWNYVLADANDFGEASIFQWRFQLAF